MRATPATVMLMDDEKDFRHVYREILEKRNFLNVRLAHTEIVAKKLIKSVPIDAAIIDIRMSKGGREGLEIIELTRTYNPYAYIEVVTAFSEFKSKAARKGADQVLIKPLPFQGDVNRIKKGIVKKKIQRLSAVAQLNSKDILANPLFNNGHSQWNDIIYKLDITIENIEVIKSVLNRKADEYGLKPLEVKEIINELAYDLALQVLRDYDSNNSDNFSNSMREENQYESLFKSVEGDKNYETLGLHLEELIGSHPGEFVAIIDGDIVDFDENVEVLTKRVSANYPDNDRFIHYLEREKTLRIRGPRLPQR